MDILVIAPTPFFSDRGCHIRIWEEARALRQHGYRPIIFTYHLGRDMGDIPLHRIRPVRWYRKTSAGPAWAKLYLDWKLFWLIVRKRRQYNFKIIHAHLHEGAWIGWWVQRFLHIPLVLDAQGSLSGELQAYGFFTFPGIQTLFEWLERVIIRLADVIVVSSRGLYEFMRDRYPASRGKIELLADAVQLEPFQQPDAMRWRKKMRQAYVITNEQLVILYTGGLAQIKGVQYLLEAMPTVAARLPQVRLCIVGYGDDEIWKARAVELGVDARIQFIGQVPYEELPRYLAMADLAIDPKPPAAHESSGKLLHYMAAGLPVIAFASSSTRAMLAGCGELVETVSADALAEKIIALVNDEKHRRFLSEQSQRRVTDHFNWSQRIDTLTALYERLSH